MRRIGSFLKTPAGVILITTVIFHAILRGLGFSYSIITIIAIVIVLIVDFFAASYITRKLVYFYSQFILPVHTPKGREEIYARVNSFADDRGPTLFVKNGLVIKHEGETDKEGLGVIVLDTASAVVTQTSTEIIGAAGPGVHFTEPLEMIARDAGVDLRAQWQFIGPLASEQPFLNPTPISNPQKYNELNSRRQQTSGHTRDGFELAPTISIKFRIKGPAEKTYSESGVISQYGYDASSVLKAVTREVIELGAAENKRSRLDWYRLPAHLVVNLWREYVRKFKLEDLFKAEGISGLQTIERMINLRVTRTEVTAMTDTGIPTGAAETSREYFQLEDLGLEIMEVRIHNILFDPTIEEQTVKNWNAEWTKIAKRDENILDEREKLFETGARSEAVKLFARTASQKFTDMNAPAQDVFTTLQTLIDPIREIILIEARANNQMDAEIKKLDEVSKWLLVNKLDSSRRPKGEK
ncbi:hypothetical protein MASR2M66_27140 [Chloroflexota bacterium]